MNKLTIKLDKQSFQAILNGEQKVVRRNVYPHNVAKYVIEEDKVDETGEPFTSVTPIHYDAVTVISGRRKDAPQLTAEIVSSEFVILTDEEDNDLTFEENGIEYYVCQVWYTLGRISETKNIS